MKVAVIGAGPAGLLAALGLAQKGAHVAVFEQASALQPVGAGLQISPNGAAALAASNIEVPSITSQAVVLRDYAKGRQVLRLDLQGQRWGRDFTLVHRADLIASLERMALEHGVQFQFGKAVDIKTLDADLIVGADGMKSKTRAHLNGSSDPFFTGQVAWRAVIDDRAKEENRSPEAQVFMGPGRHLVTYPLIDGRRNIVAVQEREDWIEEDWDLSDDPANLRFAFKDFAPEVREWLRHVEQVKLWGLFRHPVAKTWQDGRTVLVGDAAHPTLPFLAQGANLALEDAYELTQCLNSSSMDAALKAYETKRKPRVTRAIEAANANARNYHMRPSIKRTLAHAGLRMIDRVAPSVMLRKFDWLYGWDGS